MRCNNISSIANVIRRFSVVANEMLRAATDPQPHWHLQPCLGSMSGGNSGTKLLFRNSGTVGVAKIATGMLIYRPVISEPTCTTTNVATRKILFQRLG